MFLFKLKIRLLVKAKSRLHNIRKCDFISEIFMSMFASLYI